MNLNSVLIKGQAKKLGFHKIGIAKPKECPEDQNNLNSWLEEGRNGTMVWINKRKEEKGFSYEVEVSNETISKSNIIESKEPWKIGKKVNLEKSLKIGDELGGHIVTGHVDGVAKLIKSKKIDESHKLTFECPEELIKFIAVKGSVALNGTSLTVNDVSKNIFTVNIIPHTKQVTTWKDSKTGDLFNLEIDLLARYMDRLQAGTK